jgi:acetyl-CoA carboxylase biotin carboxyl carrier protein
VGGASRPAPSELAPRARTDKQSRVGHAWRAVVNSAPRTARGRHQTRLFSGSSRDRHEEPNLTAVEAHITGTVWKIEVEVGDSVEEGDAVVILESMKMEMPVEAEDPGVVTEILCSEGQSVSEGDTLVVLE